MDFRVTNPDFVHFILNMGMHYYMFTIITHIPSFS